MARSNDDMDGIDDHQATQNQKKALHTHSNIHSSGPFGDRRASTRRGTGDSFVEEKVESPAEAVQKSTFVDKEAMKEKVRQNLSKPLYSVKDYYKDTGIWSAIAVHSIFEYVTLAVIAFNAVWIAVDTDWNTSELLIEAHPVFITAENLFCGYFFLNGLCGTCPSVVSAISSLLMG